MNQKLKYGKISNSSLISINTLSVFVYFAYLMPGSSLSNATRGLLC